MSAWVLMCLVLLSANVAENHARVAANRDAREKRLESLYADYWRTEYKIAMGEHNLSSRPIQEQRKHGERPDSDESCSIRLAF